MTAAAGTAGGTWWAFEPRGNLAKKGTYLALAATGCPTLVQSPWLGMAALGHHQVLDEGGLGDYSGNHLRFAFNSALGFPSEGFDLYRRPSPARPAMTCLKASETSVDEGGSRAQLGECVLRSAAYIQRVDLVDNATGLAANDALREVDLRNQFDLLILPPDICRRVVVHVAELNELGSSVRAVAYDRGTAVAEAVSAPGIGRHALALAADRIDHIVIRPAPREGLRLPNAVLLEICYALVAVDAASPPPIDRPATVTATTPISPTRSAPTLRPLASPRTTPGSAGINQVASDQSIEQAIDCDDWVKINKDPIRLPLANPAYPGHVAAASDEWPAARDRLSPFRQAEFQPTAPANLFAGLRNTLSDIYSPPATPPLPDPDPACPPDNASTAPLALDPLSIVLLGALDPDIARMVGLYWVDGALFVQHGIQVAPAATLGTAYDYLLVGHYGSSIDSADTCDDWTHTTWLGMPQSVVGPTDHGPFHYTSPIPLSTATTGGFASQRGLYMADNTGKPLRIAMPEPVEAVELSVHLPTANATVKARAFSDGVEMDTVTRPAGNGAVTLMLLADSIDAVEIEGLDAYLLRTCMFREYQPSGDIGFINFGVVLAVAPTLAGPTTVTVDPLPVLTHPDIDCGPAAASQGQMAAGIRWSATATGSSLLPSGAVLFDVRRQSRGDGASPAAPPGNRWVTVRENILVTPAEQTACVDSRPLPGWPSAKPITIDSPPGRPVGWQPGQALPKVQRWYRYGVLGRDIFGRTSDWTTAADTDLADRTPPPPPSVLRAKYLDPDDPLLTPLEQVWTAAGGGRHGLRLTWRWWPNLQAQAPDTTQFRLYMSPGHPNVLTGNITDVDATGAVVTTDVLVFGLPNGPIVDAFAGEQLMIGSNLYGVVGSDFATGVVTLTLDRLSWTPPATTSSGTTVVAPPVQPMPVVGPFSLSVRAPKPLEGQLIGVAMGGTGTVKVKTDVRFVPDSHTPQNTAGSLKGNGTPGSAKWLHQAGTLWQITDNTAGWKFEMTLASRDCAPFAPAEGASFEIVAIDPQAPGTLRPVFVDEGNPHWRDFGQPGGWTWRVHIEPRVAEPAGTVVAVQYSTVQGVLRFVTNPPVVNPGHFIGGEVEAFGASWPVIGFDNGVLLVLQNRRDAASGNVTQTAPPVPLPSPVSFTFWPDYVIPLPALQWPTGGPNETAMPIVPGEPVANAIIGITAADDKPYTADTWTGANGNVPGNESRVSAPIAVMRVDRSEPLPCSVNNDVLVATTADFFSRSFFNVRWVKAAGPGTQSMRYLVFRALEDKDTNGNLSAPATESYILITSEPLRPEDTALADKTEPGHPTADAGLMAYTDTLDGKSASRYYYRVRALSAAGTPGVWSDAIGPVRCPDVVPPKAPVVTKIVGADAMTTLRWAKNREPDMAEYRVYRAEAEDVAGDIRLMALVAAVPATSADPPELSWSDTDVVGSYRYYYRLVAVDEWGNVSEASRVYGMQVVDTRVPEPPTWVEATWVLLSPAQTELPWPADNVVPTGYVAAVRMVWESDLVGGTFQLQRSGLDQGGWYPTTSQGGVAHLSPQQYRAYDVGSSPDSDNIYRIGVIASTGMPSGQQSDTLVAKRL